ncbi:DNA glycosylase AlkZ-like family protein, partial [Halobium palmae]
GWDAVAGERVEVAVDGESAWLLGDRPVDVDESSPSDPVVRLLPAYDTYLLGYVPENRPIPAAFRNRVWPGGGVIRPTVVVDGRVVGTWSLDRSRTTAVVSVDRFDPGASSAAVDRDLEAEVDDVGRFLDCDVEYRHVGD